MTQILKFLNFQQLLKRILRASSCLGGAIAILWVRPLYFSALQIYSLPSKPGKAMFYNTLKLVLWYCSKEYLPSGIPSAQVARTKALAITTFASCILVIPVPVLWSSLV